jgi:uridylate kinase
MDPLTNPEAQKFTELSYIEVIKRGLGVMDSTAASLCMDNKITLVVFGLNKSDNIKRVIMGEKLGTIVRGESK